MVKFEKYFMRVAEATAALSKDPSTKIGTCIVGSGNEILSTGYNGFPRGMKDDSDLYLNRKFKLRHSVHAEMNALLNAARNGTQVKGATLYCTHAPCQQCAAALIQAGVVKVVFPTPDTEFAHRYHFQDTLEMLKHCGVEVRTL